MRDDGKLRRGPGSGSELIGGADKAPRLHGIPPGFTGNNRQHQEDE